MTMRVATSDGRRDRCGLGNIKRSDLVGEDLSWTRDEFVTSDGRDEAHGMRRRSMDTNVALEFGPSHSRNTYIKALKPSLRMTTIPR